MVADSSRINTASSASDSRNLPPRVAIFTGGGDRPYALGLGASLVAQGIAFDFIASDELASPELESHPQVRFLNYWGNVSPNVSVFRKICRVLLYYVRLICYVPVSRARVFHILWNNRLEYFDRTFLLLYYRLFRKRLVLTTHNVNIRRRDGNDSWLNRTTLRIQYRLADHIFVHTVKMKEELRTDFSVPDGKCTVIPFGINSTVRNSALTSAEAKQQLGFQAQHKVMLFFGNITPYKGLEYLVEALRILAPADPDARLIIAGRPKGNQQYWDAIRENIVRSDLGTRILERIEFVPDDDTEIYFKAADVLVLPYTLIFQSGVLFLGYNFGLPVIASDIGALREEIVEGTTGFVCRPQDPSDLADTILRYFRSDLYARLPNHRESIQHFAKERYSWTKVGEITRRKYQELSAR